MLPLVWLCRGFVVARGILLCSLWAPVVRGPESQLRSCSVTWDLSSPTRDQTCAPCIARRSLTPQFSHSHVHLFATPWTTAGQASLSITISQNLLKLMSIKLVMPSNPLSLCHPLLLLPSIFPSIRVFSTVSQFFTSGGQSVGVSVSTTVFPVNI